MSASADIRKDVCCEGSPESGVGGKAPGDVPAEAPGEAPVEIPVEIRRAVAR